MDLYLIGENTMRALKYLLFFEKKIKSKEMGLGIDKNK